MNDTTSNPAETRQQLLADLRAAHPDLDIRLAPLPPEAYDDLPEDQETPQLEELIIASDGPGHYAITLPELDDPQPAFQSFFVNVNDMPGAGERLGIFTSASEAVSAAITHATERQAAHEATALGSLDFPSAEQRSTTGPPAAAHSTIHHHPQTDLGR